MKRIILIFIYCLLICSLIKAQTTSGNSKNPISSIKVGLNYSSLINTDGAEYDLGFKIGVGKEWNVLQKLMLETGLYYSSICGKLKDVPIDIDELGHLPRDIYSYDVNFSVGYIEIPLSFKYDIFNYKKQKIKIHLSVGSSFYPHYKLLIFRLYDNLSLRRKKFLYTYAPYPYGNDKTRKFKYVYWSDSGFSKNWMNFNFGFDVTWCHLMFEILYTRAKDKLDCVSFLCGLEKAHTFSFLVGYNFKGFETKGDKK